MSGAWAWMVMDNEKVDGFKRQFDLSRDLCSQIKIPETRINESKRTFQGFWHRVLTKQSYREKFSSFVNYFVSVSLSKNFNSQKI